MPDTVCARCRNLLHNASRAGRSPREYRAPTHGVRSRTRSTSRGAGTRAQPLSWGTHDSIWYDDSAMRITMAVREESETVNHEKACEESETARLGLLEVRASLTPSCIHSLWKSPSLCSSVDCHRFDVPKVTGSSPVSSPRFLLSLHGESHRADAGADDLRRCGHLQATHSRFET
ncbi:hypothetical protein PC116_g1932 [Phytophthora cactorum]|uniref:Uncharacterized protein n=1 Tax=Phytophthora cactorum TaxID=29920 RepID=A0A8T1CI37_9STRA|nr:hypothetical protein Pcac1_g24680 [Phytophthora cactorum]KAG2892324.1 hypothetical protein PC114_g16676 [Phytophthora cactorum]KAG2921803.1 hypothetical protein PC117_g16128 [Phytophthora cactorum]KAG3038752.1 hypothetical protein PC119_g2648 [Phytophthora cactorum]KAG3148938.1 hypothetical protein C6341_g17213 [Phytophthora cactorum]